MHRRALVALAILALTWTACGGGGESKPAAQTPGATSQPAMTATPNAPVLMMTLEQAGVAKRTNAPDPSMFGTSFAAADTPEAYFRVASRDTGVRTAWVETILTVKGIPLSRNVTRAKAGAWSSAQLRLPVTGDYQLTFNLLGTRETKSVTFKAEAAQRPAAKFVDAWLTTSTSDFPVVQGQPPATSFVATDSNVVAAFKLDQEGAPIVAQWKYQGKPLGEPQWTFSQERVENDRGRYIPLFEAYNSASTSSFSGLESRDNHLPGDYEVTLTNIATGENRTLKFTLTAPPSGAPARQTVSTSVQPGGTTASSFDAFARINANCAPSASLTAHDTVTVVWKHQGAVVANDYRAGDVTSFRQPLAGAAAAPLPAGEYEAQCFVLGGEAKSIKFTVTTDGVAPATTPVVSPTVRPATPAATRTP